MKNVYLALAILGAAVPYVFFVQYFSTEGLALQGFLAAAFANPAVGGLSADLILSSAAFWIFMFARRAVFRDPHPAPFIALNLLVGLSCALPAYLYVRERKEPSIV